MAIRITLVFYALIFKPAFAYSFPDFSSIFCIVRVQWISKNIS